MPQKPSMPLRCFRWLWLTYRSIRRVDRMMLAMPFQGLISTKWVGGIDGRLPGFGWEMSNACLGTHRLADFGEYAGYPLLESRDSAFSCGRPIWISIFFACRMRSRPPQFRLSVFHLSSQSYGSERFAIDERRGSSQVSPSGEKSF
jgi:hypothetical protein